MGSARIHTRWLAALTLAVGGVLLSGSAHSALGAKLETKMLLLRQQFNADVGKVRVLLVLSPT